MGIKIVQLSAPDCLRAIRKVTTTLGCCDAVFEIQGMCNHLEELSKSAPKTYADGLRAAFEAVLFYLENVGPRKRSDHIANIRHAAQQRGVTLETVETSATPKIEANGAFQEKSGEGYQPVENDLLK